MGLEGAKVQELVNLIKGHEVYLLAHNFPDPDAIGSCFGLQQFLKYYGVNSTITYVGGIDRFSTKMMMSNFGIEIYEYEEIKDNLKESNLVVNVDCQKPNANTTDIIGQEVAVVDHHPVFFETDEYVYSDIRITGACASIIASYFYETDTPIEGNVAAALAYAIKMDTSDLVRGTTQLDVEMFNYLFKYANWQLLNNMYNYSIEYMDLKAYGAAIENIEVFENIGITHIPFECNGALVATLCDFMLSLDVVDIAVLYSQNKGGSKFSIRSKKNLINAGKVAEKALEGIGNGGGHVEMAGGFVKQSYVDSLGDSFDKEIRHRFLSAIDENVKTYGKQRGK